jgi:hypothetical protein
MDIAIFTRQLEKLTMDVVAHHYVGRYGGISTEKADLVAVTIECPTRQASLTRKQIIFAVDVSGSMEEELPAVVASLLAARNALLVAIGLSLEGLSEEDIDAAFVQHCRCTVIVFSGSASCIWDSLAPTISFGAAVRGMTLDSRTNLSEGLILAFRKTDPQCATWIVVLTDGIPNCGAHRRAESFKVLVQTAPPHTKIVPLGYGNEFDPSVLSALGVMTYVESREFIGHIMGGIMGEIATCYGLDGNIVLDGDTMCIDSETIVPATVTRDIIGSPHMGVLYSERSFMYAVLDHPRRTGSFTYFDLNTWSTVTSNFVVTDGSTPPPTLRSHYFMAAKGRLLHDIYRKRNHKTMNAAFVQQVNQKLEDWTDPLAAEDKEEILRALDINLDRGQHLKLASGFGQYHTQASYERPSLTTGIQRELSDLAARDASAYHRIPNAYSTGILHI